MGEAYRKWTIAGALALIALIFVQAVRNMKDTPAAPSGPSCLTRSAIVCDSYDAISKTAVLAPGSGCSRINPYVRVDLVETRGAYAKIVTPEMALWINQLTLDCGQPAPTFVTPSPPPATVEVTRDGFAWKAGKRVGWVDLGVPAFYLLEQIDLNTDPPTPKPKEVGWDLNRETMAQEIDAYLRNPPARASVRSGLERTGDGFVWRAGRRIGWVNSEGSMFYPLSQVDLATEPPRPKSNAAGFNIVGGAIDFAVQRAEPMLK